MMGKRGSLYFLNVMIEFDECYVEVATKKQVKENHKQGKWDQRRAKVAVAAESTPLEDPKTGKKGRAFGNYKMEVFGKVDANQ